MNILIYFLELIQSELTSNYNKYQLKILTYISLKTKQGRFRAF